MRDDEHLPRNRELDANAVALPVSVMLVPALHRDVTAHDAIEERSKLFVTASDVSLDGVRMAHTSEDELQRRHMLPFLEFDLRVSLGAGIVEARETREQLR